MNLLDTILGKSWIAHFLNPNHVPAGSPEGGQFAPGNGGPDAGSKYQQARVAKPPAAHLRRTFERGTLPLRKKAEFGDKVVFLDDKTLRKGTIDGKDERGLLVKTDAGDFIVPAEHLRQYA